MTLVPGVCGDDADCWSRGSVGFPFLCPSLSGPVSPLLPDAVPGLQGSLCPAHPSPSGGLPTDSPALVPHQSAGGPVQGALGFRRPAPPPQSSRSGAPAPARARCPPACRAGASRPPSPPRPNAALASVCLSLLRVCLEARVQTLLKDLRKRPAGVEGLRALDVDEVARALASAVPSGGAAGRGGGRGAEAVGAGGALHEDRGPGEFTRACSRALGRRLAARCCLLAAGRWVCRDDLVRVTLPLDALLTG